VRLWTFAAVLPQTEVFQQVELCQWVNSNWCFQETNTTSNPRRLKSWLISLTEPIQYMVLYRKKLYICLHLSDRKENQQVKRTSPTGVPIFVTLEASILLGCDAASLVACSDPTSCNHYTSQHVGNWILTYIISHPGRTVTSSATLLQQPLNFHSCDVCGCLKMRLNSMN